MVTRSSPLHTNPNCCFLPISRVCGAEEASCHLLYTWINLVLQETQLPLLAHGITQTHASISNVPVYWSSRLLLAADIVYSCRLKKQHSDALRWHPGQNGIIK